MYKIASLFLFMVFALIALTPSAHSQTLPLGTVTVFGDPYGCPVAANGSGFMAGMNCMDATISCPNTANIGITFGYIAPANPLGTIVLFSGGAGTSPTENGDNNPAFAPTYATNYEVVQVEYASAWEDPSSNGSGGSILAAACRPATFLHYINNSPFHATGAMCAQGASAGSGAIGYSMAWYGAASYLKNVELIVGPVFSKIDQGCTYPNAATPTVCATGTSYCSAATQPWSDKVIYVIPDNTAISGWSGLASCGTSGVNSSNYPAWAAMSIVDGTSTGVTPTFNYSGTTTHGWLCSTLNQTQCGNASCPNNTSAQGKYFYDAINATGDNLLKVTGTTGCKMAEGMSAATDPDTNLPALSAIAKDMDTNCH
jgi:hypothetical protein